VGPREHSRGRGAQPALLEPRSRALFFPRVFHVETGMKDPGATAALRASVILLGAAVLRAALTPGPGSPVLPQHADLSDSLAAVGDSLAEDQERRERPLEAGEKIDVNRAGEAELDRLPGVGPAKAARIVADRMANGPYHHPEDLMRVPGIGPRSIERLTPFLDISGAGSIPGTRQAKGAPAERRLLGVVGQGGAPGVAGSVRLNHATRSQLEALPGIGPVLAQRIIEARRARGRFRSLEELLEVPGVGPVVLTRLRPLISVR